MSAHVVLVPRGGTLGRWREAFEDLQLVHTPEAALLQASSGSLFWVDVLFDGAIEALRKARPELPVIAQSLDPGIAEGMRAFERGVRGYCHTLAVPDMLRQVAVVVTNGGLWVGPELMGRAVAAMVRGTAPDATALSPLDALTPRERDVALAVAAGASNKEVARRLDITPRTVKAHMGAIFDKLEVRDRLQLVLRLRSTSGAAARSA